MLGPWPLAACRRLRRRACSNCNAPLHNVPPPLSPRLRLRPRSIGSYRPPRSFPPASAVATAFDWPTRITTLIPLQLDQCEWYLQIAVDQASPSHGAPFSRLLIVNVFAPHEESRHSWEGSAPIRPGSSTSAAAEQSSLRLALAVKALSGSGSTRHRHSGWRVGDWCPL